MRKLFVINGYPGSGKTTFGTLVAKELKEREVNFLHASTIDPIKCLLKSREFWDPTMVDKIYWDEIAKIKAGIVTTDWDGLTKDPYWRKAMSDLKLAIIANWSFLLNEYTIRQVLQVAEPAVVFVDCREPENIISLSTYCSIQYTDIFFGTVFVKCSVTQPFNNRSDASVTDFNYDYTVVNPIEEPNSLEASGVVARNFCDEICVEYF